MKLTPYQWLFSKLAKLFFPKPKIKFDVEPDDGPAIFVGNHSGAVGPALTTLYFKKPHKTWVINYVLNKDKNANYVFHDVLFAKEKKHQKFWRVLAKIIAVMLRPLVLVGEPIPVYHDKRLIETFRESAETLKEGKSIVLFAECPTKFSPYVNELYDGFVDLGRQYQIATGKKLKFFPFYAENKTHNLVFGKPIEYDPEQNVKEQRRVIADYLRDEIDRLARTLPEHKPVPFMADVFYKDYAEYVDDVAAYWRLFE